MSAHRRYGCPHCGSSDILVQYPVWVPAVAILNADEEIDGSDLVAELCESYAAGETPDRWLCTQCTQGGAGAPGPIIESDDNAQGQGSTDVPANLPEGRCDGRR